MHSSSPTQCHMLDLIDLNTVTFGEEHKSRSSTLRSFLYPPVTSSLLRPNNKTIGKIIAISLKPHFNMTQATLLLAPFEQQRWKLNRIHLIVITLQKIHQVRLKSEVTWFYSTIFVPDISGLSIQVSTLGTETDGYPNKDNSTKIYLLTD